MSNLIAITGPAYSGKTTLINHLKEDYNYVIPRHITTRKERIDDEPGFYRYVSVDDYNKLLDHSELLISSGMHDRMYGILKEDINECYNKADNVIINISYKDIYEYLLLEYNKLLVTLTFREIENSMKNRYYSEKSRQLPYEELLIRIGAALDDHDKYFEIVKNNSDCLIYTDENNEIETYQKVLTKIKSNKKNEG